MSRAVQIWNKFRRQAPANTKEIIENQNIHLIKKVKQEFLNVVAQVADADASNYRTFRLKERLQEKFPELVFQISKERN